MRGGLGASLGLKDWLKSDACETRVTASDIKARTILAETQMSKQL